MSVNNPVDLNPVLTQLQTALTQLQQVNDLVQGENDGTQTQLTSIKNELLQELLTQTDEIDATLASLTTVNGQLDSNVTAINDHTTSQHGTTRTAVTDARDDIKAEIVRQTSGSLWALVAGVINSARDNVKSWVTTKQGETESHVTSEAVSTRTTVNNARDNVNSNVDTEANSIRNTVNSARDNVKSEITRTSSGSLYALVKAWVTSKQGETESHVTSQHGSTRNTINNARDDIKSTLLGRGFVVPRPASPGNYITESIKAETTSKTLFAEAVYNGAGVIKYINQVRYSDIEVIVDGVPWFNSEGASDSSNTIQIYGPQYGGEVNIGFNQSLVIRAKVGDVHVGAVSTPAHIQVDFYEV